MVDGKFSCRQKRHENFPEFKVFSDDEGGGGTPEGAEGGRLGVGACLDFGLQDARLGGFVFGSWVGRDGGAFVDAFVAAFVAVFGAFVASSSGSRGSSGSSSSLRAAVGFVFGSCTGDPRGAVAFVGVCEAEGAEGRDGGAFVFGSAWNSFVWVGRGRVCVRDHVRVCAC